MANMNLKLEELNALSDEIITKVDEWVKNHPNATAEEVIEASVRIGMACGLDHSDEIITVDNPEEFQKEVEKALKDAGGNIKNIKEMNVKTLAAIANTVKEESVKEESFMDKVLRNKWKILAGVAAVGAAAGTAYYYKDEIKSFVDEYFPVSEDDEFILTE